MMTRPSRYSKRPLCPVCLTPFGNEALSIARSVLGLEEPHNDVLEEDPFDRDFMRGDVPGTRDEEFSLPQSYGTVYVPCPGGHETSAVYILSEVPTYLVSLVGLKSSGKTHL